MIIPIVERSTVMKNRMNNILSKMKKVIKNVAVNVNATMLELYGEDRIERIKQISEKRREKYEIVLGIVGVNEVIVSFAINYQIMWIIWQVIMDPPFGKEEYAYPFEINNALLCFLIVIILMKHLITHEIPLIDKYIYLIRYLPICFVLAIYLTNIGKSDILFQFFYLCIFRFICNSLSQAIPPLVYPDYFISEGLIRGRGRPAKYKDNVDQND